MTEYKQVPGVQTRFRDFEIRVLIDHFQCKSWDDLTKAAERYESLFFMFNAEDHGADIWPGEDLKLILLMAEHCLFENFSKTDEPLRQRYNDKPKPGPGRKRRAPLSPELMERIKKERECVATNVLAVKRLKALGVITSDQDSKTIVRYMQKADREKRIQEEQQQIEMEEVARIFEKYARPQQDDGVN